MFRVRAFPSLLIVFMGSVDCLTTTVGILCFGAVEMNPVMAGLVNTSFAAFLALKLSSSVFAGLVLFQAERLLNRTEDKQSRAFRWTRYLLRVSYAGVLVFLAVVVANNLMVLSRSL
ncbi:MAG: DUF5658 family protein [Candidatus Bathyarchaeia archaeon]